MDHYRLLLMLYILEVACELYILADFAPLCAKKAGLYQNTGCSMNGSKVHCQSSVEMRLKHNAQDKYENNNGCGKRLRYGRPWRLDRVSERILEVAE